MRDPKDARESYGSTFFSIKREGEKAGHFDPEVFGFGKIALGRGIGKNESWRGQVSFGAPNGPENGSKNLLFIDLKISGGYTMFKGETQRMQRGKAEPSELPSSSASECRANGAPE
uniref:PPIase cyclophilin-type domain-containing protein n=1 Tax=Steinernema glaseri TaxID=37863 RepID=A0A1I7Z6H6_9BILA